MAMDSDVAAGSIFRPGLFASKRVIVSGGGTGIGRATARELASLGALVVLCSRAPEHLDPTVQEIVASGGRAEGIVCNIRDPQAVTALFDEVIKRHGGVDALVNNAGGQFMSPAEAISPKGWHAVIETNLTGTFYMCQAAYAHGMKEHGGAIVNIVVENSHGFPLVSHSGAARAGVVNLTKTLALEWAQHGIRINSVAPGIIDSSGLKHYPMGVTEHLQRVGREVPAGRMGTESEVAAAVIYLLSPAAAFISGTTLRVDGGGSLYRLQGYVIPEHDPWTAHHAFAADEGPGADV